VPSISPCSPQSATDRKNSRSNNLASTNRRVWAWLIVWCTGNRSVNP
jgi:hypothetical protein